MRERTTWNRNEIAKQAAGHAKKADPYTMNQPEHAKAQPSADAYVIGTPSDFAEDVHPSSGTWEAEYSGGKVKRNEIGMPEFRGDTFNHAEKTASEDVIVKKAALCVRVARAILPKTATEAAVEDQALAFMHLPDSELISTYSRLAQDEQQGEEEQKKQAQAQDQQSQEEQKKQAQDQQQSKDQDQGKQAQDQGQDKQQDQGKQAQDQQQDKGQAQSEQKQAGELPPALKEHMEKKKDEAGDKKDDGQKKEAQGDLSQIATALQAMQQGDMKQAEQALMAACQQMAQQMMQQMAQGQQQAPAPQGQGQALAQQPQMAPTSDDQLLDQMLADQQPALEVLATDIELEAPSMDVGDATLDPVADAQLLNLFANQGEAQQAEQAKQAAHGVRTASTRTVGARPTGGVSRLGGAVGGPASSSGDKNLSSIWNSAPDVSDVFGVPRS